jgi:type III pantothenate kinase
MLLVVDVGNSHTVSGMYDGDNLIGQWRMKSDRQSTADELAVLYQNLFIMSGVDVKKISGIVIASVVPTLETAWRQCCEKYFSGVLSKNLFLVDARQLHDLITVKLDNPQEVGPDRLVNAIGAWHARKCKQVIIDFGTAITFDCVTEKCEYLGGAILPGIAISLEALATRTARLPHIDITDPPKNIIGKNTVQAMKSGILFGYGGMIDSLVGEIRKEMTNSDDEEFQVVATGGMSRMIATFAKSIAIIDPMLTIMGLQIIYRELLRLQS